MNSPWNAILRRWKPAFTRRCVNFSGRPPGLVRLPSAKNVHTLGEYGAAVYKWHKIVSSHKFCRCAPSSHYTGIKAIFTPISGPRGTCTNEEVHICDDDISEP